ncbi:hypothetical protein WN944_003562 [Citrus x changshan-huyou]|uniref:Uncharacterized protein n=1 Tax=Citrus x changshan-huyou TaxID=2935761 RepID=A0AAP0QI42_9ROSI
MSAIEKNMHVMVLRPLRLNNDSEEIDIEGLIPPHLFDDKDGKIVLRYNPYGVPCGPEGTVLSTFLGVLARTSVPITDKD